MGADSGNALDDIGSITDIRIDFGNSHRFSFRE